MPIDKTEFNKFMKMFDKFNKGKLLKGFLYTASKKNAQLGKKLFQSFNFNDNGVLGGLERKGFMKGGLSKASRFAMTNRSDYVNGDAELWSSVYNKRKFSKAYGGVKSGFHYGNNLRYVDRFVYKRFGSPVEKFNKQIQKDFDKGVKIAIDDAMRKVGFSK